MKTSLKKTMKFSQKRYLGFRTQLIRDICQVILPEAFLSGAGGMSRLLCSGFMSKPTDPREGNHSDI